MGNAVSTLQAAQEHALAIRPKTGGFPVLAEVLHRAGVHRNEWYLPLAEASTSPMLALSSSKARP